MVTLEPVAQAVSEPVDMEFWPAEQVTPAASGAPGAEIEVALEGPEPYSGGSVDLGQIAYEVFAAALDPYPRKPGAEFAWASETDRAGEEAENGPFAALKALKE